MIAIIILLSACFLAFSNGANDNFKGVSTLFGSGTTDYKKAINWGTITTLAGCLFAIYIDKSMYLAHKRNLNVSKETIFIGWTCLSI